MPAKKQFAVSFDLDEGWEQTIFLSSGTLKEAQKEAVGILYDFNPDLEPEEFEFNIYEIANTHAYDLEDFQGQWEALDEATRAQLKAQRDRIERDELERLKKKFGE